MPEPIDVVEALLFASDTPVEAARLQEVLDIASAMVARERVETHGRGLDSEVRALQVVEVGGGYRLVTRPEVAPWLVKLARSRTRSRLSRPSLETLAIIGYRQPVSRPEVDAIRGVNSEAVLDNLLERRMIRIAGPPLPLRDHPRVPRRLRAARSQRSAEGGRRARRARAHRDRGRAARRAGA